MTARLALLLRFGWLLLFVASPPLSTSAGAQSVKRPAGYVTAVEAQSEDGKPGAVIRRDGQELDVQIWTSLFAGDVLEVRGSSAVTIETVKDKRLKIDAARSPHRVEGALPSGGRMPEVAALIGDLFHARPSNTATNLIGRADQAPSLRMGAGVTQRVVSGEPVWVGWQNGTPPFTIEIIGQTGNRNLQIRVLGAISTESREALIDTPRSASGHLALVVRDAAGREARLSMLTGAAPTVPKWVEKGSPTPEFANVAAALHLLRQKPNEFAVLAGARAARARDYPPATALLMQLTGGRVPK